MLAGRALLSVVSQTRQPDYLVVVDDSCSELRSNNRDVVAAARMPDSRVRYLENARTDGASGAWNTALYFLFRETADPASVFVAILDDDDTWAPTYLDMCLTLACERQLDMVAADLRRIEDVDGEPITNSAPASLRASVLLTGNPGIQGSSLFVRLSVLLHAGGFDEGLRSSTDRDLCIRIADLPAVRYERLPVALVDHFADADRARLSTRGSSAKIEGLTAFWHKYRGRMTGAQRGAFCSRAESLFDWNPLSIPTDREQDIADATPKIRLVLGLVADNGRPLELLDIARELAGCQDENLWGLDVVLFEQGMRPEGQPPLDAAAKTLRDAGVGCFCVTLERQEHDVRTELLAESFADTSEPRLSGHPQPIHAAYCCRIARTRAGTEVWLTDGHRGDAMRSGTAARELLQWLGPVRVDGENRATLDECLTAQGEESLDAWIERERVATAAHWITRRFSLKDLRLLGCGSEGVVFTDEDTVYKCIDYWKTRMPASQLDFLREQVGRWEFAPGLYPLHQVVADGRWAVITYEFEASGPYEGGHEDDLVQLLNTCSRVGVVCNNVHPKNLIVTASGVALIDYGSDIRPWSPLGFEHMARRAFLAKEHARHPDLRTLMRRALTDPELRELAGYPQFRRKLNEHNARSPSSAVVASKARLEPPEHQPFALYVGVISADPMMLAPLLTGLARLRASSSIERLVVVILDNGSPADALRETIKDAQKDGLQVAVVGEDQQHRDAALGAFGTPLRSRPDGQVGIARARTMLQRYIGTLLRIDRGSFGWLLDDDMRVDERAFTYLPWLPAFREAGVDALIGHYEWSSPNPPLNGIRVHLVDLLHNLIWLRGLPADAALPDRTAENAAFRAKYPDYYYDLSRKHTAHLEMPHWLEPAYRGETACEAYSRLLHGAAGILSGTPLTRPIVAELPHDPLAAAKDSVNRGGCTFVLNPDALTLTPNTIPHVRGREARRSDMIWAIVNRYYRRMSIKAVGFPIHHVGRVTKDPSLNIEKVRGEIIGSSLYAGLTDFLRERPQHDLDFSSGEAAEIRILADHNRERRLHALGQSFYRIAGLRETIRSLARPGELEELMSRLDRWFTPATISDIRARASALNCDDVDGFIMSLRAIADDFAAATVDAGFIQDQLQSSFTDGSEVRLQ